MTTTLGASGAASAKTGYPTVAALVRDRAAEMPNAVAMREKDFGIWQEITGASSGNSSTLLLTD
jgi:hypothetical protein